MRAVVEAAITGQAPDLAAQVAVVHSTRLAQMAAAVVEAVLLAVLEPRSVALA